MRRRHRVYISAGSNMGDRLSNCRKGFEALQASGDTVVRRYSRFYKTEPVDYTDQEWFVNAVVEVETSLDPPSLLERLQAIQRQAGRVRDRIRFGPRILDLDIILFDDLVLNSPTLVIPHPRMHERRFVLKPICDINPGSMHPVLKKNAAELLDNLEDAGQGMIEMPCDC
jgi:2-amino-4-hydroxy-6-hydroxymethyldihydropteridine diphosphokinase